MQRFGIFSPLYVRKDMHYVLLTESLMPDARNIRIEDGVIVRQNGREREMWGTYGTTQFNVPIPASVHPITSITSGTKKIAINGNHASSFTAGQIICVSDTAAQASDGHYTVVSATFNTPNTEIVVTEAITTGGAVGNLLWGAATALRYYNQIGGITGDTEFLFVFTANHAFLWDSVKCLWKLRHTTSAAVNWWSVTSMNGIMVAGNWGSTGKVDKVVAWDPNASGYSIVSTDVSDKEIVVSGDCTSILTDGMTIQLSGTVDNDGQYTVASATYSAPNTTIVVDETVVGNDGGAAGTVTLMSFYWLGGANGIAIDSVNYITGAKYLTVFENYLWLGYVAIGSTVYPRAYYWSDHGSTEFDVGDGGGWNSDLDTSGAPVAGSDFASGFGEVEGSLILFKESSTYQVWLVATDEVWNATRISHVVGTKSPDSIVRDGVGRLYFLSSDGLIREIRAGSVSDPIDPIVRTIEPSLLGIVRASYIRSLKEIWWAVPALVGGMSPSTNNTLLQLSLKDGSWQVSDISVSAFGAYSRQVAYTWDNQPDGTWDDWGGTWDEQDGSAGHAIDLVGDYSGYTWAAHAAEGDAGGSFEAYFELGTDLSEGNATAFYKRLLEMRFMFESVGASGTVTITISADGDTPYTSLGTVDASGSGVVLSDLPCDVRGRHFRIRLTALVPFKFLGCIFGFEWDGEY